MKKDDIYRDTHFVLVLVQAFSPFYYKDNYIKKVLTPPPPLR